MGLTKYMAPEIVKMIREHQRAMDLARCAEQGLDAQWADTPTSQKGRELEAHRLAAEQTGAALDDYGQVHG